MEILRSADWNSLWSFFRHGV